MKKIVTVMSVLAILGTSIFAATGKTRHHHTHKLVQSDTGAYGTGNVVPYQFDSSGKAHRILSPTQQPTLIPRPKQ